MSAGGRSTGSWAVLAIALAVPGVLFYGWWSRMDAAKKKELNQRIRNRGVAAFTTSGRNKEKLSNPMATSGSELSQPPSGDALAAGAAPASEGQVTPILPPASGSEPSQPPSESTLAAVDPLPEPSDPQPQPQSDPQPGPSPEPAVPGAEVSGSTLTADYFLAASGMPQKDPTTSPLDLLRLQREELERQLREQEIRDLLNKKETKKRRVVEEMPKVEVQGIIESPDGFQAIVNDNLVRQGDTIAGGKVKVLRITPQTIHFVFGKKRFTRSVNQ